MVSHVSHSYQNMFISNPLLPYFGTLPPMSSGSLVIVYGRVPFGSKRFDFNFMVGSVITQNLKTRGDIAFHFNPRFDDHSVVRNSRKDNNWGEEEREPKAIPFSIGSDFVTMILIEDNCYKVAVNGKHFIDFYHRIQFSCVGVFSVEGDVQINKIEFKRNYSPPAVPMHNPISHSQQPIYHPALPYHHVFANGVSIGLMIYISGRLSTSPDGFAIDFCCGTDPFSDIAFHFNVRYRESVVVRNTKKSNNWGPEERQIGNFPFSAGVNFDMIVRIESNRYMIAVNGQHFVEYYHRIPIQSIRALTISGDLIIASLRFAQT